MRSVQGTTVGTHDKIPANRCLPWVPAFAGMTVEGYAS